MMSVLGPVTPTSRGAVTLWYRTDSMIPVSRSVRRKAPRATCTAARPGAGAGADSLPRVLAMTAITAPAMTTTTNGASRYLRGIVRLRACLPWERAIEYSGSSTPRLRVPPNQKCSVLDEFSNTLVCRFFAQGAGLPLPRAICQFDTAESQKSQTRTEYPPDQLIRQRKVHDRSLCQSEEQRPGALLFEYEVIRARQ